MLMARAHFLVLFTVLLSSCAIQVPPGGGDKDTTPPRLLSSEPANYSTGFRGKEIRLNFDEYIALKDIGSQLIVSPLLKSAPEVFIRKKSLILQLTDTLLGNTTYTINFGQGIVDNNEGNILDNFQFVFSTGAVLDSLSLSGNIVYSTDLKSEKGLLALLYRKNSDSLPFLERPVYFSRTNDSGDFHIKNISPGSYKIIGLKESDGNYLYTPGEEWIGFSDSAVTPNTTNARLKLFKEQPRLRLLKAYSEYSGKAVLVFNTAADTLRLKWLTDTAALQLYAVDYSAEKDSITIWYENINADTLSLFFDQPGVSDTLAVRLFKGFLESRGRKSVELAISPGDQQTGDQHLYRPFFLKSNHPLVSADFSRIVLLEDSLPVTPVFQFLDSLHLHFSMNHTWKTRRKYSLFIPPAVFKDFYGLYNDSVSFSFSGHNEMEYGSLKLHLQYAGPVPCIVQLTDEPGNHVFREFIAHRDTIYEFNNLDPRYYRIKLIRDNNNNGRWDTGNYLEHLQPEMVQFSPDKISIRSNWDVDVRVLADFPEGK
jgi:hypothetical protein